MDPNMIVRRRSFDISFSRVDRHLFDVKRHSHVGRCEDGARRTVRGLGQGQEGGATRTASMLYTLSRLNCNYTI